MSDESTREDWGVWCEPAPANLGTEAGWMTRQDGSTYMDCVFAEAYASEGNRLCGYYYRYSVVRRVSAPPPAPVTLESLQQRVQELEDRLERVCRPMRAWPRSL